MTAEVFHPEHVSQVRDGRILCPLCDWSAPLPQPQYAPAVAAVFGMSASALADIHMHSEARRLENEIKRHLSTHPVQEWLVALMKARDEIARLQAAS